jgi:branched-chain amino acid transport system substrate-binding protein
MKFITSVLATAALTSVITTAANAQEQYLPLLSYRVGPYAAAGSGFFGGVIDYMNLVNSKGGINGVKIAFEECETEYNPSRGVECYERLKTRNGGASFVEPMSTGIAYGVLDRVVNDKIPMTTLGYGRSDSANGKVFPYVFPLGTTYWNLAAAMIKHLADKSGPQGLKGKKIAFLYLDGAYGKEPFPVLDALSKEHQFELVKIPVAHPGNEQQSQWLQIRQANPDHVILWGFGVMNTVALKTAQRNGIAREKILGSWWAGSEEDVVPAGDAAKGYSSMAMVIPGSYPVVDEIRSKLYEAGKGNLDDKKRIGSVYHMRGIAAGILSVEAIRKAQDKYGKGKVLTSEQIRWGFENLNIDEQRQKELGALGMFPAIKTSCEDHEGSGATKVLQWDGAKWKVTTPNWIVGDKTLTRRLLEESSSKYAAEKGINPRCVN